MNIQTSLSKELGLKHAIVAAPMFIISNAEMILACAEAGILGTMPSLNCRTAEEFTATLEEIGRKTDKPYGINIPLKLSSPERIEHDLEACFEHRVPVMITSLGSPKEVVQRAHPHGIKVFADIIGLKHAQAAAKAGVDAIIAVAAGAGGHGGTISPYALFPWIAEETQKPVIASGCISDGRHVAASLALGAELAYMGTRFIASHECAAPPEYKQAVIDASPEDIVYTAEVSGINGNYIKHTVPSFQEEKDWQPDAKKWKDIWGAGQGVGQVKHNKPIGEIVEDIVREYTDAVRRLSA